MLHKVGVDSVRVVHDETVPHGRLQWAVRHLSDCRHEIDEWCRYDCANRCEQCSEAHRKTFNPWFMRTPHAHCRCGAIRCHGPWWRWRWRMIETSLVDRQAGVRVRVDANELQ